MVGENRLREQAARIATLAMLFVMISAARPIPILDLDDLASRSEVIVLGKVTALRDRAAGVVDLGGQALPSRILAGQVQVHQVLKGPTGLSQVHLRLSLPDASVGYQSVPLMRYRLLFLKASGEEYEPVSPYYPSVIGLPASKPRDEATIAHVISVIAGVLQSPTSTEQEKLEAIFALRKTKSAEALAGLRGGLVGASETLKLTLAAALLERNDLSVLGATEQVLLQPKPSLPHHLVHNLIYAVSEKVTGMDAIPTLARLLSARDTNTRRAAASALRRTGTSSAIRPLASALKDPDREVRYLAVVGLAEITGQTEWRPNMDDFLSRERSYVGHWTGWAKENGFQ